jgi:site-specific DNA-methyltransferase (adenine-specific)
MSIELDTIYPEDCLQTMSKMPESFIDLVVTSPPYDNLKTYNGFSFDFEGVAGELYRVLKPGGVVVWVVGDATLKGSETGTSFKQALYFLSVGFNLHDTMIWKKSNVFNFGSNNCYRQSFEYMFVFSKGKPKTINLIHDVATKSFGKTLKGARKHADGSRDAVPDFIAKQYKKRDNVWVLPTSSSSYGHPATFPESLANDHIVSWSEKADVVYDPFIGSGTTAKMAIINKRHFIGSEISQEYVDIAKARLQKIEVTL